MTNNRFNKQTTRTWYAFDAPTILKTGIQVLLVIVLASKYLHIIYNANCSVMYFSDACYWKTFVACTISWTRISILKTFYLQIVLLRKKYSFSFIARKSIKLYYDFGAEFYNLLSLKLIRWVWVSNIISCDYWKNITYRRTI